MPVPNKAISAKLVEAGSGTGLIGTGFKLMSGVFITVSDFLNLRPVLSPVASSVETCVVVVTGRKSGGASVSALAAAAASARFSRPVSMGAVTLALVMGVNTSGTTAAWSGAVSLE